MIWGRKEESAIYVLADDKNSPLLVKYDSSTSYLPVFENERSARDALENLKRGAPEAVCNPAANYRCQRFVWAHFKQWQEHSHTYGHMLFVYPMSPQDYGAKA